MEFHTRGAPCLGKLVCILNPEVRRASPLVVVGPQAEMNLDAVTGGIRIPAALIYPCGEAKSLIVRHGDLKIVHGEYRRNPLEGAHAASFAQLQPMAPQP